MKKPIIALLMLLSPTSAFAIKGMLIGTVGYESLVTKWEQGGDDVPLKGFSLGAQYSLPVVSLSSATSLFIAPGLRMMRVTYEATKEYDFGKQDVSYKTTPYFIGGDVGIHYAGSSVTFNLFGLYYHCLGGELENTLYTHQTKYTSESTYDYKTHTQYGGGARFIIPTTFGLLAGLEGTYYVSEIKIQNQESEADASKLNQTAWAVKLVFAKKMQ